MNYTIEQFHADVAAEAKALREHATKEELSKLHIQILDPNLDDQCVYGLMVGSCFDIRVTELIKLCCKTFFKDNRGTGSSIWHKDINETLQCAKSHSAPDNFRAGNFWSAIEAYIALPKARRSALIAYLRGETDDLVL